MMKKRFLSLLLALSMTLGLSAPTLAAEMAEAQMEARIEAEVQAMEQEVYAEVYRQLEEQDGLHMMDLYMEILGPKIRAAVEAKYVPAGCSTMAASNTWTMTSSTGGTASYKMLGNVRVVETYMKPSVTLDLIAGELAGYGPSAGQTVMEGIIRAVHEILDTNDFDQLCLYLSLSAVLQMIVAVNSLPTDAIRASDYYACVISTTDPTLPTEYAVTVAWTNHPVITVNLTSVIGDVAFEAGA